MQPESHKRAYHEYQVMDRLAHPETNKFLFIIRFSVNSYTFANTPFSCSSDFQSK